MMSIDVELGQEQIYQRNVPRELIFPFISFSRDGNLKVKNERKRKGGREESVLDKLCIPK